MVKSKNKCTLKLNVRKVFYTKLKKLLFLLNNTHKCVWQYILLLIYDCIKTHLIHSVKIKILMI